tara:strand:+ start:1686 stop:2138 length:453 start_codon:yes stop_codon:yes gene_type:complete
MDAFDYKILQHLKIDSRIPLHRISEKVGLSISSIGRRIHSMEKKNIIEGYTLRINEKKLGFNFPVFVFVRLEKQRATNFSDFENEIKRFSEVVECWLMTGSQDYLLKIITKDVTEFERFLTLKLTTIEGVSSVDSSVPLRCAKQSHHRIE